jgi:hypothetical protein
MKRVYLDIETYSKGDEPSVNDKVIAIGVMEEDPSRQRLFTEWGHGSERDVIRKFYKELRVDQNDEMLFRGGQRVVS